MFSTPTKMVRPRSERTNHRRLLTMAWLDTLARVSLYLLSQPSDEFSSLVAPLLTPEAIPNTALVILLDWAQPHLWLRQICQWIALFRSVAQKLGHKEHAEMEEIMESWKMRGRGGASTNLDGTPSATAAAGDGDSSLPQGPGEWSDPLGLPLCLVCQNVRRSLDTVLRIC